MSVGDNRPRSMRDSTLVPVKDENTQQKTASIKLNEFLVRAAVISPEQLEQAATLISRMPVPLSLGRVLAMQGHVQENTIESAAELCQMIEEERLTTEQGLKALELVGKHGLTLDFALKRIGVPRKQPKPDAVGELLRDASLIQEHRLEYVLRCCAVTELPPDLILVCTGAVPRTLVRAAETLKEMIARETISREKAISVLQSIHHRSITLEQALAEEGVTNEKASD
jgi:hypothetical protein